MTKREEHILAQENGEAEAELTNHRPGLITVLISLLVLLALLATLVAPLLQRNLRRLPRPTPTPSFLREAWAGEGFSQTVSRLGIRANIEEYDGCDSDRVGLDVA